MNRPETTLRSGFPVALAGVVVFSLFGCGTIGGGNTEVYGDYGYVGSWDYVPFIPEGYVFARPPYERWEAPAGHISTPVRNEPRPPSSNPKGPPAGHVSAPIHNAPRPPPSIPNHPRPSGGGGGSHPGGGGGGHSPGSGSGSHPSGGGSGPSSGGGNSTRK
jgi:hypothetical protein